MRSTNTHERRATDVRWGTASFVIGLSLFAYLLPWSYDVKLALPNFPLFSVLFLIRLNPYRYGANTAFCVGLLEDLTSGTVLGTYALLLVVSALLANYFFRRHSMTNEIMIAFVLFALIEVFRAMLLFVVTDVVITRSMLPLVLLSITSSALLWSALYAFCTSGKPLHDGQQHF